MEYKDVEQSVDHLMKFFKDKHLSPHLQSISRDFNDLAYNLYSKLPNNEEKIMTLRKLLEAKDCAVRSVL